MGRTTVSDGNVAEEMLRVLPNHRSWVSGRLAARHRRCLVGARLKVAGLVQVQVDGATLAWLDHDPYLLLLTRIIREQFPERAYPERTGLAGETPVQKVISFNDWESTHFTDIRLVLEKAAASWAEHQEGDVDA